MEKKAPEQPDIPDSTVDLVDVILRRLRTMRGDGGLYKRWVLAAAITAWSISETYGWPPLP